MDRNEKLHRLKSMLAQVAEEGNVESLAREPDEMAEGLESAGVPFDDEILEASMNGVQKVARQEEVSDDELFGLEAIVMPRERPVVFIQNDSFGSLPAPWTHFARSTIRKKIEAAIPSVGRIELPDSPLIPFAGTGFIVGDNLLMTNRHVGELFASGLGTANLAFRPGQSAEIDFKREKDSEETINLKIRKIVMIHPHWDMVILRVDGLPSGHNKLALSVVRPEELKGKDVAVIGYPARDSRNDIALQDRIFSSTYNVKRLHPGRIRTRETIQSFGHPVNAMTHDSSTLGGNSGSAVLDVATGNVVGLHFAGIYLRANYCVPTYELARDKRVVDAGINFSGSVAPTNEWLAAWRIADPESTTGSTPTVTPQPAKPDILSKPDHSKSPYLTTVGQGMTFSIPLNITISLGDVAAPAANGTSVEAEVTEGLKEPFIAERLSQRKGYQSNFLELDSGEEVPLPTLTAAGRRMAAKLDDDSFELKYHKFSLVMHKKRRLALFTAANVDWRSDSRLIEGRKPTRKELTGLDDFDLEKWKMDSRIPKDNQLPDLFFTKDNANWDKGHLVRRDDVCWGKSINDIRKANGDTFHTTNCSPQTAGFNRSAKGVDNWGDLENLVQKQSGAEKVTIFSGPALAEDDPLFLGKDEDGEVHVQIPRKFWKVVVAKGANGPEAFGFMLEQDLAQSELEFIVPGQWRTFMRPISEIEGLLNGLASLSWLKKHDQFQKLQQELITR